jgi:hypothetical protein
VDVADVTSPEDDLEQTTVDDGAGPGLTPYAAPASPAPELTRSAVRPPWEAVSAPVALDVESTWTMIECRDAPPLPLTVPRDVQIREVLRDEPLDDTEVRTAVSSPFPDPGRPPTDAPPTDAPPSEPPDEDTVVGAPRPPNVPRPLLPRVGPVSTTPAGRNDVVLPELDDDDDGKDDDAYEADESVTLRGPARSGGTALTVPGAARPVPAAGARAPYEDDQNEAADDAESVTKPAPKPLIPSFVTADEAAREDEPASQTAVMPSSPYRPATGPGMAPPAPALAPGGPAWSSSAPAPRPDSESRLGMAAPEAFASSERVSIGALMPPPPAQPGSGGHGGIGDAFGSGAYVASGHLSTAAPPTSLPTPPDGAPVRKPGYLWLVGLVAGLSVFVPLALFFTLREPAAQPASRAPTELVPDPIPRGDPVREKARPAVTPAPAVRPTPKPWPRPRRR